MLVVVVVIGDLLRQNYHLLWWFSHAPLSGGAPLVGSCCGIDLFNFLIFIVAVPILLVPLLNLFEATSSFSLSVVVILVLNSFLRELLSSLRRWLNHEVVSCVVFVLAI